KVFEFLLGRRCLDGGAEFGRELALLLDALEDGFAPLLQLAQVGQPRFEFAQVDVVEAAGGLLAVAGDEGDAGAAVEEVDGRPDLLLPDTEFGSDLPEDLLHGGLLESSRKRASLPHASHSSLRRSLTV